MQHAADTSQGNHQELATRLTRLERSNRRMKLALGAAVLAVVGLGFTGFVNHNGNQPASRREIQTQRLVILGEDSHPRAMLAGLEDGSSFFLSGPDQYTNIGSGGAAGGAAVGGFAVLKPRVRFMIDGEGSRVEFLDPGGQKRMVFMLDKEGPAVRMFDPDGNEITD